MEINKDLKKIRKLMAKANLKLKLEDENLIFRRLGEFEIEKDNLGSPIPIKVTDRKRKCYLLNIITNETKDRKSEKLTVLPNQIKEKLKSRKYFNTKRLKNVWSLPGIYIFASVEDGQSELKYRYIGRASNSLFHRMKCYLGPSGSKRTTDHRVNRLIYRFTEGGGRIFIYFCPELDTEKELHRRFKPAWNKEK